MSKLALTMLIMMTLVSSSFAQSTFIDTVTITAPDALASETGPDPGLFEIRRSGPTNYSLYVFYRVGGTASNGVTSSATTSASTAIPDGSYMCWNIQVTSVKTTGVNFLYGSSCCGGVTANLSTPTIVAEQCNCHDCG